MPEPIPSHVRVELDDALIPELPRMFGGRTAAFREVLQNAYRAGACNVTATLDGHVLVIEDDGHGCPDPRLLLSAGTTGWDKSRVVEPAGLGFYSLLDEDIVTAIDVQSGTWSIHLVPKHILAKQPAAVETLPVAQAGFRLRLTLVSPDGVRRDLEKARGYCPFRLTLNCEEVAVTAWQPTWDLDTPVGKVGVRRKPYSREHRAIWEHRPIEGEALEDALKSIQGRIAQAILQSCSIHWMVDARSGVAAKLPDRNDLVTSPALDAAAVVILASIEEHLLAEARAATADWPDVLPSSITQPEWLLESAVGAALLEQLGWHAADRDRHEEHNLYYIENDGWQNDNGSTTVFTRRYLAVADYATADSVNNAIAKGADLPWAVVAEGGLAPQVVEPATPATAQRPWIIVAKEIRLGDHRLPFLLPHSDEQPIVLACNPDTAVAAVTGTRVTLPGLTADVSDLLVGYAAATFDPLSDGDWADYDDNEPDWSRIEQDLVEQLSNDFIGGNRAKARQRLHNLQAQRSLLHQAALDLHPLEKSPAVAALSKAIQRVEAELDRKLKATRKKAQLPQP